MAVPTQGGAEEQLMKFKPLVSPSLSEMFVEELESMILSGELSVGDKLPTERELAQAMQVSRAVINGGTSELANIGFLEVIPRKGIYVADYKSKGKIDVLQVMLEHRGGVPDPAMLESVLHFRETCERDMARLAAVNRKPEHLAQMRKHLASLRHPAAATDRAEHAFELCRALAIASGSMVYPLVHQSFQPIYLPMLETLYTQEQNAQTELLEALVSAVERQDQDAAEDAVRQVIAYTKAVLARCCEAR